MGGHDFEEARRREPELNERQREVLDLLVDGKTNGEIGEALGITLDGAKWNVSEILTKLGLDSREEAADYWRWRNRGVRKVARAMRGMVAGISLKAAVGAAGGVVVGVTALAIWLSVGTDERATTSGTAGSFYLEASLVVRSDPSPQDIGRSIAGSATPTGQPTENRLALRWWYLNVDHARFELDGLTPSLDQRDFVVVYDGKEQWSYDSSRNSYTQDPLPPMPPELKYRPIGLSAAVGPVGASSVDDFMALYRTAGNASESGRAGESTLLGRRVEIVELRFSSMAIAGSAAPGPTAAGTTTVTPVPERGVNRFWIDPATMFVLKNELTGSQSFVAEVTKLEMGVAIPAEKLRFQPPAGSVRTTSSKDSGRSSGFTKLSPGGPVAPPGFLGFRFLPNGYRSTGVEEESDGSGVVGWNVRLEDERGRTATVQQRNRANGLPASLQAGNRTNLPFGTPAYAITDANGRTLAFQAGDVSVAISSAVLSFEELDLIAASMLVP